MFKNKRRIWIYHWKNKKSRKGEKYVKKRRTETSASKKARSNMFRRVYSNGNLRKRHWKNEL